MTAEVYLHFEIVNNADVLVLVFTPLQLHVSSRIITLSIRLIQAILL